jgi:hypothetical protein
MSQVRDLLLEYSALFRIRPEAEFKPLQYLLLFTKLITTEKGNIVQMHQAGLIHEPIESIRSVSVAKGHNLELPQSLAFRERSL